MAHQHPGWDQTVLQVLVRGDFAMISAPPELCQTLEQHFAGRFAQELLDPHLWNAQFGPATARTDGPLYQGYIRSEYFIAHPSGHMRRFPQASIDDFRGLAARVGKADWEQSALDRADSDFFAYMLHDEPVAVAHYSVGAGNAASLGVLTDPRYRRSGYAIIALSSAIEDALHNGLLVLYQSLKSNQASLALAQALGTIHYGWTINVRLSYSAS